MSLSDEVVEGRSNKDDNEPDEPGAGDEAEEDEGSVHEGEEEDGGEEDEDMDNAEEEDDGVDDDDHTKNDLSSTIPNPPPKPVPRARLAYSIFCDEYRPEIQIQDPDLETEKVAAELNKRWRDLSEDEQKVYREKAIVEQEEVEQKQIQYESDLKAWKDAGGVLPSSESKDTEPPNGGDGASTASQSVPAVPSSSPQPKAPSKPIKRAATAYFLFSSERRSQLRSENPGASVAVIAKELGKLWNALSEEDKKPYNEKAAEERERVAQDMLVWEQEFQQYEKELAIWKKKQNAPGQNATTGTENAASTREGSGTTTLDDEQQQQQDNDGPSHPSNSGLIFPVARIKKIAKLDPEVRGMSKDALLLITRCAELATSKLGLESVKVARAQNRRKLLPEDVAHVCSTREQFIFLKDDIKDLVRELLPNKTGNTESMEGNNNGTSHRTATSSSSSSTTAAQRNRIDANNEAAVGTKRLASYFSVGGGNVEKGHNDDGDQEEEDGENGDRSLVRHTHKKDKKEQQVNGGSGSNGDTTAMAKKNVEAAKGSKPLTSYFGVTNKA